MSEEIEIGKKNDDKLQVEFETHENITNDKIREIYIKLLTSYRSLLIEKNKAIESLRYETLVNEEQKNFIEILKHTIETKLDILGLKKFIKSQKNKYYNENSDDILVILDITNLKAENDTLRKEMISSNILINQLKNEKEQIKEDYYQFIKGKQDNYDELKENLKKLENSRDESEKYQEKINKLIKNSEKLQLEKEGLQKKINNLEKENLQFTIANLEIQNKLQYNNLKDNKLTELKEKNDSLKGLYDEISFEKEKLNIDYMNLNNQLKVKIEEMAKLDAISKDNNDKFDNEKQLMMIENKNLIQKIKKIETILEEKENLLEEKIQKIKELNEKYKNQEIKNKELQTCRQNINNDSIEFRKLFEKKTTNFEKIIKELKLTTENYKENIDQLTKDKEVLENVNSNSTISLKACEKEKIKLEEEILLLEEKNRKLSLDIEELVKINKTNEKERIELRNELSSINNDIRNSKEKYEKDLLKKNSEIKEIIRKNETDSIEIKILKESISSLKE